MSELLTKVCGFALVAAMLALVLRKWGAEQALLLRAVAGVTLALLCLGALSPLVEYIREIGEIGGGGLDFAVTLMLRVLSVAMVTHICATICRDCGEGALASYVELGGKVEILILSLPAVKKVVELAVGVI